MPKKVRIILALVVLIASGTGLWLWQQSRRPFRYAGTIEAETLDLSTGLASPIAAYLCQEGQKVAKGQVLVELDCREVRLAARLAALEASRSESLYQAGTLSKQAYDRALFSRDEAAVKVSWCQVVAPIGGTVLETTQSAGEWARPGQRLLSLADLSRPYALIFVEQGRLAGLRLGQAVTGHLPEDGDRSIPGRIALIRDQAEFTPKNVQTRDERSRLVYGVKVAFEAPEGLLKPGMPIEVDLEAKP